MDYEKKYEEALSRAIFYKENTDGVGAKDVSDLIEGIFPELKKPEYEKAMKETVDYIKRGFGLTY